MMRVTGPTLDRQYASTISSLGGARPLTKPTAESHSSKCLRACHLKEKPAQSSGHDRWQVTDDTRRERRPILPSCNALHLRFHHRLQLHPISNACVSATLTTDSHISRKWRTRTRHAGRSYPWQVKHQAFGPITAWSLQR